MRPDTQVGRSRVAAAFLAGLLLAGCQSSGNPSGQEDGPSGEPTVDDIPVNPSVASLSLPLEAHGPGTRSQQVGGSMLTHFVDQCLTGLGFPPFAVIFPDALAVREQQQGRPTLSGTGPVGLSRRYGVTEPEFAQRYGYRLHAEEGFYSPPEPEEAEDARARYGPTELELIALYGVDRPAGPDAHPEAVPPPGASLPELDPDGRSFNGRPVPEGGCDGQARELMRFDELAEYRDLVVELKLAAFAAAQADSRVTAVMNAWSACMREQGYDYQDIFGPGAVVSGRAGPPTPEEIATAVADVRCKQEHNVVGVFYAVEVAYQNQLIEENFERLDHLARRYDEIIESTARQIEG